MTDCDRVKMYFVVVFGIIYLMGCDALPVKERKHSCHSHVSQNKQIRSFLYNASQISTLLIDKNGFSITPLDLQINTEKGIEFDSTQNLLFWIEDYVLHVKNLSSLKTETETIWVPDRVGHIFHYDSSNKNMYWYPEECTPSQSLRMTNLNSRHSTAIKILETGTLKAIDSLNQIFFYEFEDSIKMYSLNGMKNINNFTFDGDFNILDVVPHSKYIVVCQNTNQAVEEETVYIYRFLGYDGSEKYSIEIETKYEQIFMEDDFVIYKQHNEIGVINKTTGETLFSVNNPGFWQKTLKHLYEVQDHKDIKPLSSTSAMECTDDDTSEICFRDEGGSELEHMCLYQAFIISDGTSFKYYNPASGSQPFNLPFPLNGTIRAFATYLKKRIFWINEETNVILGNHLYSDKTPVVIGGKQSKYPSDIKVDEYRRNVFWTDRDRGTIEVADFEGKYHRVLFQSLNMPTKLILALDYGLVIWAEGALNNTVKAGWIAENAQKVLLECKVPIFGFVLDYIYNILYVGSQNEYLYIQAVNLNLGYRRDIYKSKSNAAFSYMAFSSGNYLYLMEPKQFWKFNVWSLNLEPIPGMGLNASLISPLRCPVVKNVDVHCLKCEDFCFPASSTSFFSNVDWQCYNTEYISLRESKCFDTSAGFMLASTDSAVYLLNEHTFTKVYDLNSEDVSQSNPIAFDKRQNRLFIASKSGNSTSIILSDPCTQPEGEQNMKRHPIGGIGGLIFNDEEYLITNIENVLSYLDPYSSTQKISFRNILSEYPITMHFSVPKKPLVYFSSFIKREGGWKLNVFNLETNEQHTKSGIYVKDYRNDFIPDPYYGHHHYAGHHSGPDDDSEMELSKNIQLSYLENFIYYWEDKALWSVTMGGESQNSTTIENMPNVETFTIFDRKMYFVSGEDQMLYRLDYLSESKSITPILNVPKNIKYLLSVEK